MRVQARRKICSLQDTQQQCLYLVDTATGIFGEFEFWIFQYLYLKCKVTPPPAHLIDGGLCICIFMYLYLYLYFECKITLHQVRFVLSRIRSTSVCIWWTPPPAHLVDGGFFISSRSWNSDPEVQIHGTKSKYAIYDII